MSFKCQKKIKKKKRERKKRKEVKGVGFSKKYWFFSSSYFKWSLCLHDHQSWTAQ